MFNIVTSLNRSYIVNN